jgi:hypothetical protein
MIRFLLGIFALSLSTTAFAQVNSECNFLKHLKFKNGTDTIVLKATYVNITEVHSNGSAFDILLKKGKIKTNAYNDQVTFRPINCKTEYAMPDGSGNLSIHNLSNIGKTFYFTLVAFERKDWYYKDTPFCLITRIRIDSKK